jgi:chromatin-remodeling ATPase INO80
MAGGPPFTVQSPTQSARFVPYSPTSKPNTHNYEAYQHPPQTPPSFPSITHAQSPSFGHPGVESSPPSAMNGDGHNQHFGTPAQYMTNPMSSFQQHSRTVSGPLTGSNGHINYGTNTASSHAHPSSRQGSMTLSPRQEFTPTMNNQRLNGTSMGVTPTVAQSARPASQEVIEFECLLRIKILTLPKQKPVRANDPMSFASILSEPATHMTPSQNKAPLPASAAKSSHMLDPEPTTKGQTVKIETEQALLAVVLLPATTLKLISDGNETPVTRPSLNVVVKPRKSLTTKEYESVSHAMEIIDSQQLSDVDEPGFAAEKERYAQKGRKRVLDLEEVENKKRKVRALLIGPNVR